MTQWLNESMTQSLDSVHAARPQKRRRPAQPGRITIIQGYHCARGKPILLTIAW